MSRPNARIFHTITIAACEFVDNLNISDLKFQYRKIVLKYNITNINIYFNSQCLKLKLYPKYISNSTKRLRCNKNTLNKIRIKLIRGELGHWYNIRDSLRFYRERMSNRLAKFLNHSDLKSFVEGIESLHKHVINKKRICVNKKIESLKLAQENKDKHKVGICQCFPRTINYSDVHFSDEELMLLNKGLKYCPDSKINRMNIVNLMASVECATNNSVILNACSVKIDKFVRSRVFNGTVNPEVKILKCIKTKMEENNLVFTKSDKGQSLIIMDKDVYNSKVSEVLSKNKCEKVYDPTESYNKKVRVALDMVEYLYNDKEVQSLIQVNASAPKLYCLPKVHKDGVPFRPIVSFNGAPTEKLGKRVVKDFKGITNFRGEYSLNNSLEFIKKIKTIELTEDVFMVSFDIVNLFSCVPPMEVYKIADYQLSKSKCNPFVQDELLMLFKLCLDQNYFRFQGETYRQKEGLAMGSPVSPLGAELFVDHLERSAIMNQVNPYLPHIKFWSRYVDDVFCLFTGDKTQLENFFNYLNTCNPHIEFTMETESVCKINYLDLTLTRTVQSLEFNIFRKPTCTDITIPATSNHHHRYKLSAFYHLAHRLFNVPMSQENFQKEVKHIIHLADVNGFTREEVDRVVARVERKHLLNEGGSRQVAPDQWCSLPFLGPISNVVGKILKRDGIRVSYKSGTTLGRFLCNSKDKSDLGDSSGVYRLECGICSASYVGRTLRKLKVRCKEHLRRKDSHFYEHLTKEGHVQGPHMVSLLHKENKTSKLNKLEELEILLDIKRGKSLNARGEAVSCRILSDQPPDRLLTSVGLSSVQIASLNNSS